jgi:hypothetical protein
MTVRANIDPAHLLEEQLAQASPDLLRELLTTFVVGIFPISTREEGTDDLTLPRHRT